MDDLDPFAKRVKDRFDELYADCPARSDRYPSWGDFFPRAPGASDRRAYDAEAIRCTAATYERAMHVLDAICKEARSSGFEISMGWRCTRIDLSRGGAASSLRIVEPSFRANTDLLSGSEKRSISGVGTVGTGWLELLLNEHSDAALRFRERSSVADLVERVPEVMSKLESSHAAIIAFWEKRRRRDMAVKVARAERENADRELTEEHARRAKLIESAQKWHAARMVREYVVAMEESVPLGNLAALDEYCRWRDWALGIANDLELRAQVGSQPSDSARQ